MVDKRPATPPPPHKKKKKKMGGPLRVGIALIILGAFLVGLGTIFDRESISLYGFVVVVCGFFLYFASYYYLERIQNKRLKK